MRYQLYTTIFLISALLTGCASAPEKTMKASDSCDSSESSSIQIEACREKQNKKAKSKLEDAKSSNSADHDWHRKETK